MKTKIFTSGCLVIVSIILLSFQQVSSLEGTWEYCGDVFNGKAEAAPTDYTLQRKYTTKNYESFLLEKGEKPQMYEAGNYTLNADTCLETQTFSAQESKLVGVPIRYIYTLRNDTLTLSGNLPNGNKVVEYWKKK
jgi:uncharacterized protein (TIGR03067 family)